MGYLCPARKGSGMARISEGGLGKRPQQREEDLGSGAALIPAPLGGGRTRGHRREPQPDQRCQAGAWGSRALHVRPQVDPGHWPPPSVSRVNGTGFSLAPPWSQLGGLLFPDAPGCSWPAKPGSQSGERSPAGKEGAPGIWSVVGACGPPSLPRPLPALHTPREGKVRMMTCGSFVCGLRHPHPPREVLTQKQYFRFLSVLSVPSGHVMSYNLNRAERLFYS